MVGSTVALYKHELRFPIRCKSFCTFFLRSSTIVPCTVDLASITWPSLSRSILRLWAIFKVDMTAGVEQPIYSTMAESYKATAPACNGTWCVLCLHIYPHVTGLRLAWAYRHARAYYIYLHIPSTGQTNCLFKSLGGLAKYIALHTKNRYPIGESCDKRSIR